MLLPIFALFIVCSAIALRVGQAQRNIAVLLSVTLCWWPGALLAAYFTWLVWRDRAYSENWAMLGFLFFTLPYAVITGVMLFVELFLLLKWQPTAWLDFTRINAISLLIVLACQVIVGALVAK